MREERADTAHGALVLDWARRLMATKGYGWSKAIDVAARYAAPAPERPAPRSRERKHAE